MKSIAPGVFELKDQDESHWYRVIFTARIGDEIYVLHSFTKQSAKTEANDLRVAKARWKYLQQRVREEKNARKR